MDYTDHVHLLALQAEQAAAADYEPDPEQCDAHYRNAQLEDAKKRAAAELERAEREQQQLVAEWPELERTLVVRFPGQRERLQALMREVRQTTRMGKFGNVNLLGAIQEHGSYSLHPLEDVLLGKSQPQPENARLIALAFTTILNRTVTAEFILYGRTSE